MLRIQAGGSNGHGRGAPLLSPARRRGTALASIVAAALALLAGGYWFFSDDEGREIRALPAAQREGLYHRTMENLKTICDPAPGRSMREFCREQATLALKFPECDDECHRTARRNLSLPRP